MEFQKADSVSDAWRILSNNDPHVGSGFSVQLTGEDISEAEDFEEVAKFMRDTCCAYNDGIFLIDGDLWFIGCDYGQ